MIGLLIVHKARLGKFNDENQSANSKEDISRYESIYLWTIESCYGNKINSFCNLV